MAYVGQSVTWPESWLKRTPPQVPTSRPRLRWEGIAAHWAAASPVATSGSLVKRRRMPPPAGKRDACRYDAAAAAAQNSKRYLLIVGGKRLARTSQKLG